MKGLRQPPQTECRRGSGVCRCEGRTAAPTTRSLAWSHQLGRRRDGAPQRRTGTAESRGQRGVRSRHHYWGWKTSRVALDDFPNDPRMFLKGPRGSLCVPLKHPVHCVLLMKGMKLGNTQPPAAPVILPDVRGLWWRPRLVYNSGQTPHFPLLLGQQLSI